MRIFLSPVLVGLLIVSGFSHAASIIPPPPKIAASSYLLIDADTQRVLIEENSDLALPPASLTKIMTSYIAGEEMAAGRVALEDEVPISVKAWRTEGSRMFIQEGTSVRFVDLLRGVIIQSGNDASVAIAEHIAGSEEAFADMMTQQAIALGMTNSNFANSTGLPAEGHLTSAHDLALLTTALINNHPEMYAIYAERSFSFNNIEQPNRNRLLWRDRTVDGVKTGHTDAAGYCLVASAERNGMRLISVVMGTANDEARMIESQKLLSYGFRYFETRELYQPEVPLKKAEVWYGDTSELSLGLPELAVVTFSRGRYEDLQPEISVPSIIEAPVQVGDEIGELRLRLDDETVYRQKLVALEAIEEGGMFSRFGDFIYLFFRELFGD